MSLPDKAQINAGPSDPEVTHESHGEERDREELWKYACQITLDPNTAQSWLTLPEGGGKVSRSQRDVEQPYPAHPERFVHFPQVLCREGLSGKSYWEVEWTGSDVFLGVTYKGIGRKDDSDSCEIGMNPNSWCLIYSDILSLVCHDNRDVLLANHPPPVDRVGVYLDWSAGVLSFFGISSGMATLLHTFHTTFTESLYPGFWVYPGSVVSLCQQK